MLGLKFKIRKSVTGRLLSMREQAAGDHAKHARFHAVVNRYQRLLTRHYLTRYRIRLKTHWYAHGPGRLFHHLVHWVARHRARHQSSA